MQDRFARSKVGLLLPLSSYRPTLIPCCRWHQTNRKRRHRNMVSANDLTKDVFTNNTRSFIIALHLFNILFLRFPTTKAGLVATLCFGWASVATIVIVGPAVIQTPEKGPYFSISGNWCVCMLAQAPGPDYTPTGVGSRIIIPRSRLS
jgi:hypothetical protein